MEKRVLFKGVWLPAFLLLPQIAITITFFFVPAGQALYQSLFRQDAFGLQLIYVGLGNFQTLLQDPGYLASFRTTAIFAIGVTILGLATGLCLAWFADRLLRFSTLMRTLVIIPYAIAPAIAGVLWMFMFTPGLGIVSYWLKLLGIDWNYLLRSDQALLLVILIAAWKQISYNFLFFLAGLQGIPKSLLEAAAIDGAGVWRRFRDIVLPLLAPTTFFLFVINVIYAFFDTFAIIDAVTQGGPFNSTETLVYKVYRDGFRNLDFGGSAAQSVILMTLVIILTFLQFRYVERKISY